MNNKEGEENNKKLTWVKNMLWALSAKSYLANLPAFPAPDETFLVEGRD